MGKNWEFHLPKLLPSEGFGRLRQSFKLVGCDSVGVTSSSSVNGNSSLWWEVWPVYVSLFWTTAGRQPFLAQKHGSSGLLTVISHSLVELLVILHPICHVWYKMVRVKLHYLKHAVISRTELDS